MVLGFDINFILLHSSGVKITVFLKYHNVKFDFQIRILLKIL